jgi:hypothetical protein
LHEKARLIIGHLLVWTDGEHRGSGVPSRDQLDLSRLLQSSIWRWILALRADYFRRHCCWVAHRWLAAAIFDLLHTHWRPPKVSCRSNRATLRVSVIHTLAMFFEKLCELSSATL